MNLMIIIDHLSKQLLLLLSLKVKRFSDILFKFSLKILSLFYIKIMKTFILKEITINYENYLFFIVHSLDTHFFD